jgi:hypothetical protein
VLTLVGVGAGTGLLLVLGGSGLEVDLGGSGFFVVVVSLLVVGCGGADVGRLMLSVQRPPMHVMMYVWRGSRFAGACDAVSVKASNELNGCILRGQLTDSQRERQVW